MVGAVGGKELAAATNWECAAFKQTTSHEAVWGRSGSVQRLCRGSRQAVAVAAVCGGSAAAAGRRWQWWRQRRRRRQQAGGGSGGGGGGGRWLEPAEAPVHPLPAHQRLDCGGSQSGLRSAVGAGLPLPRGLRHRAAGFSCSTTTFCTAGREDEVRWGSLGPCSLHCRSSCFAPASLHRLVVALCPVDFLLRLRCVQGSQQPTSPQRRLNRGLQVWEVSPRPLGGTSAVARGTAGQPQPRRPTPPPPPPPPPLPPAASKPRVAP